jgi:prolipoprotein diacylglyceryl transferase
VTTTYLAYIPSPSQGVWHLGPLPIRAYAVFILVGIIAALLIGDRRWAARGGEPGVIYDIAIPAVLFGLIGGRLYHVITDWDKYIGPEGTGAVGMLRVWDGGLGIWGAVALGGVGAWIGCRYKGIPLPAFGDAIAPGIVLAQAIGRLGNYFNQELYGRSTTLPWGLEIYERLDDSGMPDALDGVSTGQLVEVVHPTFLYELLWNLLVFAALIYIDRRFKIGHGRLFAMYVAGYCLGRFWIELMRSDPATLIEGIRINSFTATFVFIGAVVYIMVAPKGREDPATLKGKEPEGAPVAQVAKELAAVGATTGVVAAAKVAGEDEDEDAKSAEEEAESEVESEAAAEAEALAADVGDAPSEDIVEAAEFAAAGEEADEAQEEAEAKEAEAAEAEEAEAAEAEEAEAAEAEEAEPEAEAEPEPEAEAEEVEQIAAGAAEPSTDAESLGADVAGVPAGDITEAEEFAAAGEEAEPVGEVGAVEGEQAIEAQEAVPETQEPAVERLDEAEDMSVDVAGEPTDTGEPAAVERDANEEPDDLETEDSAEEPETEDAVEAVDEAADAAPSEEEVADVTEAVLEEAEATEESEPEAEVLEEAAAESAAPEEAEQQEASEAPQAEGQEAAAEATADQADSALVAEPPEESGGRLRRWLRARRNG